MSRNQKPDFAPLKPTLEISDATILYYLSSREKVETYLEAWRTYTEQAWLEHERNPSPEILRLRELKAQRTTFQKETAAS